MENHLIIYLFLICGFGVQSIIMISKFSDGTPAVRAEVQSCRGCALNRLQEVKTFIFDDLPKYPKVEFRPIPGATPDLVLFNTQNKEIDRINLSPLSRKECNKLMDRYGFKMNKPTIKKEAEL